MPRATLPASTTISTTTTTTTRTTSTTSTTPTELGSAANWPDLNYVFLGDMNAAWTALENVLSVKASGSFSMVSARGFAHARADAAVTYQGFITHQKWPPKLQPDVDAELSAWTRFALAYEHTEALPDTAALNEVNPDIDAANLALRAANTAHSVLKRDLISFMCTERGVC